MPRVYISTDICECHLSPSSADELGDYHSFTAQSPLTQPSLLIASLTPLVPCPPGHPTSSGPITTTTSHTHMHPQECTAVLCLTVEAEGLGS